MKRYLMIGFQSVFLVIVLVVSFELLLVGKVLDFMNHHHRLVTGTDPVGAKQVVQGAAKAVGWVIGRIREYIARYIRNFHPAVWQGLRNYLKARR